MLTKHMKAIDKDTPGLCNSPSIPMTIVFIVTHGSTGNNFKRAMTLLKDSRATAAELIFWTSNTRDKGK
ncbi:hypothetical protein [Maridesulfovibrio bastinii]|uniref:hypothetical protein n=1 Tax=Maridesulfovibrio bastinii TaxID=47157 RepID=UPI0012EB9E90|nr:hypothetical protein [Maridesulfovibrio bastinii]